MLLKPEKWDGKPIDRPCWIVGMPLEDYHRHDICVGPSASSTTLKTIFNKGAKHFFRFWAGNPNRVVKDPTKAMLFGSASHAAVLEMHDFRAKFVVQPATYPDDKTGEPKPWHGGAKYCKKWAEENAGKIIISSDDLTSIRGMARELSAHPMVKEGILNGFVETSLFWQDEKTGIWLKVRPDVIPTSSLDISDFKSTAAIDDDGLAKAVGDLGMNQQGALVGDGVLAVIGEPMNSFTLVFSQTEEPHEARVHSLIGEDLELGQRQNRVALDTFDRCLKTGVWPGIGGEQRDAQHITILPWKRKKIEERIKIMEAELSQ